MNHPTNAAKNQPFREKTNGEFVYSWFSFVDGNDLKPSQLTQAKWRKVYCGINVALLPSR
jgi:hypothetical protein